MEEWQDEVYVCENCGYDGSGKFYNIMMRGWPPIRICEKCMEEAAVYNE